MSDYSQNFSPEEDALRRRRAAIRRRKELAERRKKRIIFSVVLALSVIGVLLLIIFSSAPEEEHQTSTPVADNSTKEEWSSNAQTSENDTALSTEPLDETDKVIETTEATTFEPDPNKGNLISDNTFTDVLSLSNKSVPYGNDWEDKDAATGLANGVFWYEAVYGKKYECLYRIKTSENTIYLTMDEGYEAGYTKYILDTLKEKNVKAVFFITKEFFDYCDDASHEDLIKRMLDEGHIIGNHTCLHPGMKNDYETYGLNTGGYPNYLSYLVQKSGKTEEEALQVFVDDLQKLHKLVYDKYGYTMKLFRFPEGEASERLLATCKNYGYTPVFWSYAHRDFDTNNQPEVSTTLSRCLNHLAKGSIYLLHAVSSSNTAALPDFIDQAREKGFEFGEFSVE